MLNVYKGTNFPTTDFYYFHVKALKDLGTFRDKSSESIFFLLGLSPIVN